MNSVWCLILLSFITFIRAVEIDFDLMKRYQNELLAGDDHDAQKTLEMFFDTAGLEEMFSEYGQAVSKVYEGHLERALALRDTDY